MSDVQESTPWRPVDLRAALMPAGMSADASSETHICDRREHLLVQRVLLVVQEALAKLAPLKLGIRPPRAHRQTVGPQIEVQLHVFGELVRVLLPRRLATTLSCGLYESTDSNSSSEFSVRDQAALAYVITKILATPLIYRVVRISLYSIEARGNGEDLPSCDEQGCLQLLLGANLAGAECFDINLILPPAIRNRLRSCSRTIKPECLHPMKHHVFRAEVEARVVLTSFETLLSLRPGERRWLPVSQETLRSSVVLPGTLLVHSKGGAGRTLLNREVSIDIQEDSLS